MRLTRISNNLLVLVLITIVTILIVQQQMIDCKVKKQATRKSSYHRYKKPKPKFFRGNIKYVNLYFPINPKLQLLYEDGYKGGYGKTYIDYHRGKIRTRKYPFKFYKKKPEKSKRCIH
ncbi:hypothetical protein NH340_JMT07170 [Sarcoptes scabiei]|nr:hypothetical protein NH340_JMT07170 [Sarcoptes scabiei]